MNRLRWLLAVPCVLLTGCWFSVATSAGNGSRESTGTLGKYQFASPAEVKAFNAEVSAWLSERGFVPYTGEAYAAIVGENDGNWKEPGLLLCRQYDVENRMFVFIPDCHRPEKNIQLIGFHVELKGDIDDVDKHSRDFDSVQESFRKAFPSTAEPKP